MESASGDLATSARPAQATSGVGVLFAGTLLAMVLQSFGVFEPIDAALRGRSTAPSLTVFGSEGESLVLLGTLGLSALALWGLRRAQLPALGFLIPLAVGLLGLLLSRLLPLPVTAMVLISGVPVLAATLAARRAALQYLQRVKEIAEQETLRSTWRSPAIRSEEELLIRVASLARSHAPQARVALLLRADDEDPKGVRYVGGFGLSERDLDAGVVDARADAIAASQQSRDGVRCDRLLAPAGLSGRVLALRQAGALVGWWVLAWEPRAPEPDPATFGRLARWVSRNLQLGHDEDGPTLRVQLADRLALESSAVEALFAAATEERARQVQTFHALALPVMVADVSGAILFRNRAADDLLEHSGLASVGTVRELLYRLSGEEGLQDRVACLFVEQKGQGFDWRDPDGHPWRFRVEPVIGGSEQEVLGYAAWFEDCAP